MSTLFCQIAEIGFIFTNPLVFCGKCDIILYIEEQSRCQRVQVPEIRGVDFRTKTFCCCAAIASRCYHEKDRASHAAETFRFLLFFIFPRRKAFSWCDCVSVTRRCFFYDKNQKYSLTTHHDGGDDCDEYCALPAARFPANRDLSH